MKKFLVFIWLFLGVGVVWATPIHKFYLLPVEVSPEREYGYIKDSLFYLIYQSLSNKEIGVSPLWQEKRNLQGEILKSSFFFSQKGPIKIELSLGFYPEKKEILKIEETITFENFWAPLSSALDSLISQRQNKSAQRTLSYIKSSKEENSLLAKLNPFKFVAKLLHWLFSLVLLTSTGR